jgi:predicted flap endonuclease-1-like 5' DNA nuclease
LERIRGIGPRYAALLVAGGIRGLADLARADPAELGRLLGVSAAAPMAAPARWISQARELSGSAP